MDLVALSELVDVFREQELQQGEHMMDVVEVIHGLTAVYEKLEEEQSILVNIPLCVDMCLNWLLNVYDRWVEALSEASTFQRSCFDLVSDDLAEVTAAAQYWKKQECLTDDLNN